MYLNIVIPVLNEENSLANGVEKTIQYLNATVLRDRYRITIADNGSTDNTEAVARTLTDSYPMVDYFKVSQRGVGLAFREAIKRNNCDVVGYMDVDLATDLRHLKQVCYLFKKKNAQIVVGSRLKKGAKVYGRTLLREITSRGLNIILKLLLQVRFTDAMCGFKFYRKDVADRLVQICSDNNGWFYCAEMMIRAEWNHIKVTEIPVIWRDDTASKVKVGALSMSYMKEILKLCKIKRGMHE